MGGDRDESSLGRLLEAMGGVERILGVRTFASESIRVRRRGIGETEASERRLVFRAAGGRVRIETIPMPLGDPVVQAIGAAGPQRYQPRGSEAGLPPVRWEAVLRDVALEPRNMLAHIHERNHAIRVLPGGAIEIAIEGGEVLYRFDALSGLCDFRRDARSGALTRYLDWIVVAGIATPFLETRESPGDGVVLEDRAVAVAYDLPLPDSLFST